MLISKNRSIYAMDKAHDPVLYADSGSTVIFETIDAFGGQITEPGQTLQNLNWEQVNPATGPLYVRDAMPGDVMRIDILDIEVHPLGIMAAIPGAGLFAGEKFSPTIKFVPLHGGYAQISDKLKVPLKPMIGVIGVAPSGEPEPCGVPGSHGGNMDNARLQKGTTLYLPVFVPGALLAVGDLHALQGDGEVMVTGIECGGTVTLRVSVLKGESIVNPRHEDEEYFYTIASHVDLLQAVRQAAADMRQIVMQELGLSFEEAGMLISAVGDAQICQVVDPKLTARFAMPRAILTFANS